jgi:hypothetical protein
MDTLILLTKKITLVTPMDPRRRLYTRLMHTVIANLRGPVMVIRTLLQPLWRHPMRIPIRTRTLHLPHPVLILTLTRIRRRHIRHIIVMIIHMMLTPLRIRMVMAMVTMIIITVTRIRIPTLHLPQTKRMLTHMHILVTIMTTHILSIMLFRHLSGPITLAPRPQPAFQKLL